MKLNSLIENNQSQATKKNSHEKGSSLHDFQIADHIVRTTFQSNHTVCEVEVIIFLAI